MSATQVVSAHNHLIAALPGRERQVILGLSEPVDLLTGMVLCEPDDPLEFAYFPLNCLISLMATTADHQPLGVAIVGNEGVLGATLALGVDSARQRDVVLGSGSCLRLPTMGLAGILHHNPEMESAFKRHAFIVMGQLIRTAACNSFHEVEMRLARWLLMIDDRSSSDRLPLTHQVMADLLGVQRSAVTIAAGKLQRKRLISYARGQVSIVSREGLERMSCECYGLQTEDYARQGSAIGSPERPIPS